MRIISKISSVMLSAAVMLGTVSLPTSAEEYGELEKYDKGGFSYQRVDMDDDGTYDYIYIVEYYNEVADVVIPDEIDGLPVTAIGYGSFGRSSNLTSVAMGKNVSVICDKAFMSCESLKTVKLSDNIEQVGRKAFTDSLWLNDIRAEKKPLIIGDMLVDGVGCEGEADIPDTVTRILPYAFENAVGLTSVTMSDSVTWAGESSFEGCESLTSIKLSSKLTSIEERTFNGCSSLNEIVLPESVKSIGILAFSDCHSLTRAEIHAPDCEIPASPYVFVGGYNDDLEPIFKGTICGYANSTAQTFAEEQKYRFELLGGTPPIATTAVTTTGSTSSTTVSTTTVTSVTAPSEEYLYGDVDLNGMVELADVTKLAKYIIHSQLYALGNGDEKSAAKAMEQADVTRDGNIDALDLSKLIEYNLGNRE